MAVLLLNFIDCCEMPAFKLFRNLADTPQQEKHETTQEN